MDTSLGERIKVARGELTQAEFAERIGVHKNSLSRYERNANKPDSEFIAALRTKYGIS
ncbi:helix-turn-helix domain-containing protein [Pseudodesulfovibrio thermohalotolerans]|uniref:helix-turn-helix domain-containing protein n=1 Tax=Pseudodesulfovibrio thermohalotolerans TaxID=2880651 RepID=UPI00299F873C|nr:helix-turn-helix transcriptional regulator [Pseudodesulfovibrio thermohalotolerans]